MQQRGMEEKKLLRTARNRHIGRKGFATERNGRKKAPENGKESSHSAHANGMYE
jgi:hypothetical protein